MGKFERSRKDEYLSMGSSETATQMPPKPTQMDLKYVQTHSCEGMLLNLCLSMGGNRKEVISTGLTKKSPGASKGGEATGPWGKDRQKVFLPFVFEPFADMEQILYQVSIECKQKGGGLKWQSVNEQARRA